jgi:hypothetical protein
MRFLIKNLSRQSIPFYIKIKEKKLLLCTKRPVLQPHLAAVALPAPRSRDGVLAAALEAYLEEQPALLRDLFLCCVRYWHLLMMQGKALLYVSTIGSVKHLVDA